MTQSKERFKHLLDRTNRSSKSLKCYDCKTTSNAVYKSSKYDKNLCVPCLMIRIKTDISQR